MKLHLIRTDAGLQANVTGVDPTDEAILTAVRNFVDGESRVILLDADDEDIEVKWL